MGKRQGLQCTTSCQVYKIHATKTTEISAVDSPSSSPATPTYWTCASLSLAGLSCGPGMLSCKWGLQGIIFEEYTVFIFLNLMWKKTEHKDRTYTMLHTCGIPFSDPVVVLSEDMV